MRLLSLLASLAVGALAGCPNSTTLNLDIASSGRPVRGAVATAVCGDQDSAASLTDQRGRARLDLREQRREHPCAVTVASPDHDTARFEVDRFCDHRDCAPIEVELAGGDR
jgi:hypothetical protein